MDKNIDSQLIEKALPIIDRSHLDAPGARPGGDRIKIGSISAKKCLAVGDEAQFGEIMKVLNDEIKFSTGNRGMQHDFSFHHRVDRVNTTYSYGLGYAGAFAEWVAYVADTKYSFEEEKLEHFIDYYLDGICKQMIYGIYIDKGVMNRSISRKENFKTRSSVIPEKLMKATDYRKEELNELIELRERVAKPSASFCKFFWQSEHFVCQRPGFYTSVRMYSRRNRNMEQPYNSEGLLNHHRGDGTNYISITGEEYVNIWPSYDWQKIPGTTVLQKPELIPGEGIQKDGLTEFVGAVTDELYGAVAFDFVSPHDFIKARKSWFFFDDEYVCLGAEIESTSAFRVSTTMDQSLLKGETIVSERGHLTTLSEGEHEINEASWVHHNGIGYIFPEPESIHVSNAVQSGSWYDINKQWNSSKTLVNNKVFKLWIDHGVRPQGRRGGLNHSSMVAKDVKYQYIVIPNSSVDDMNKERGIEILANNRLVQGVRNNSLGIVQIVFYQAGKVLIAEDMKLSVDSPGIVMLKMDGGQVQEITVADPSRKLSRLHMCISGEINSDRLDNLNSEYNSERKISNLTIDLPAGVYAGQSVNIEF
jgi:chondroitin AC lyase